MKNLVFQYYIPYESFDADMGGIRLPEWAHAGSRSAKAYADYCDAEYELSHNRFFDQIDPRLDSIKIVFDKKYDEPLYKRGIIAYGKHLWGEDWMFPKSKLYPDEKFRYMNGGLQLWSKEGRLKARKHFTSVDNYILHTRYTEQMYINLQLSQPIFEVTELDTHWNRMPYQWRSGPDGKINHFLARTKFDMPRLEKTELSIWESS